MVSTTELEEESCYDTDNKQEARTQELKHLTWDFICPAFDISDFIILNHNSTCRGVIIS